MKVAFCNVLGSGHVNPTLPIVEALARRGDDVTYYCYPQRRAAIEAAGARFRNYGSDDFNVAQYHPKGFFPTQLLPATAAVLPYLLEDLERLGPQVIVTDSMAPWGLAAGRVLGKPVLGSVSTFAMSRARIAQVMLAFGATIDDVNLAAIATIRERWGVVFDPADLGFHASEANVVYTAREFNPPLDDRPERFEFIGAMTSPRAPDPEFPLSLFEQADRKRVYISMGTVVGDALKLGGDFYQKFFDAFGERSDYIVALSLGAGGDPHALNVPSNFVVRRSVPQLDLLGRVDAFVTHAGMNSMCEAMSFGVPVVCLPFMADQPLTAEQARARGAGLTLDPRALDAGSLLTAVERVIREPSFRQAARVLQAALARAGGVPRALEVIDELGR